MIKACRPRAGRIGTRRHTMPGLVQSAQSVGGEESARCTIIKHRWWCFAGRWPSATGWAPHVENSIAQMAWMAWSEPEGDFARCSQSQRSSQINLCSPAFQAIRISSNAKCLNCPPASSLSELPRVGRAERSDLDHLCTCTPSAARPARRLVHPD